MLAKKIISILSLISFLINASETPWDLESLNKAPQWQETELAPSPGMKSILYESISYNNKDVQVFAYYAIPEGDMPAGGWPAVVLIHGGGGTAFPQWVQKWNEHGYAAISMDLEGHLPLNKIGKKGRQSTPLPGPSRVGVFHDYDKELNQQWYYHAIAQIISAHSLIRSFPEVNAEKTGVTGISWGGNLTSSVMGVDTRFKFAIPGYGCGYLSDSTGHQGRAISDGKHSEIVDKYYDGKAYFKNVDYPTLWINGTNDYHFSMPAFQKSSDAVNGQLRFELEMGHGHGSVWNLEESYAFADSIIKGSAPLIHFEKPVAQDKYASVNITASAGVQSAQLLYTSDKVNPWPKKKWFAKNAKINQDSLSAELPPGTEAFLFTATDKRKLMSSSSFIEHSVAGLKKEVNSSNIIDYDQLYQMASSAQPRKRIIIADNFENGISKVVQASLNCQDPKGIAGMQEWYDQKASGGKSLEISNSPSVEHGFMPALSNWFRNQKTIGQGTLNISFDILLSDSAAFNIQSRDYSGKSSVTDVSIHFNSTHVKFGKETLKYPKNEWLHVELSIPVKQLNKEVVLSITDPRNQSQSILYSSSKISHINWVGLMLVGKNSSKVYIDNYVISHQK